MIDEQSGKRIEYKGKLKNKEIKESSIYRESSEMECIEAGRIKMAWEHGLNAVEQQYQNIIHVFYDSNYAM